MKYSRIPAFDWTRLITSPNRSYRRSIVSSLSLAWTFSRGKETQLEHFIFRSNCCKSTLTIGSVIVMETVLICFFGANHSQASFPSQGFRLLLSKTRYDKFLHRAPYIQTWKCWKASSHAMCTLFIHIHNFFLHLLGTRSSLVLYVLPKCPPIQEKERRFVLNVFVWYSDVIVQCDVLLYCKVRLP